MEIKFNGVDRLYNEFWYRLTRRAMETWNTGRVVQGEYLQKFETKIVWFFSTHQKKKPLTRLFFLMVA